VFFGGRLPDVIIRALLDRLAVLLPPLRIEGKPAYPRLECAPAGSDTAALGVATLPLYTSFASAPRLLMKRGNSEQHTDLTPAHHRADPAGPA